MVPEALFKELTQLYTINLKSGNRSEKEDNKERFYIQYLFAFSY